MSENELYKDLCDYLMRNFEDKLNYNASVFLGKIYVTLSLKHFVFMDDIYRLDINCKDDFELIDEMYEYLQHDDGIFKLKMSCDKIIASHSEPKDMFKPNNCVKYIVVTNPEIRKGMIEDKQNFINFLNSSINESVDKIMIDCIRYILENKINLDVSTSLKLNDVLVFSDLKVDNLIYTLCILFDDATKESKLNFSKDECEDIIKNLKRNIKQLEESYRYILTSNKLGISLFKQDFKKFIDNEKNDLKIYEDKLKEIEYEIGNL